MRLRKKADEPKPDLFVACKYVEGDPDAVDDLSVNNPKLVHLEMLDDHLATLMIYGERGTDDYVQIDLVADGGKLMLVQM
jgi:hypothetical protein